MKEKKRKPPSFPFYPDSWLSSADIMMMTPAQEGAYIRLLSIAWLADDCGLPDDDEALAMLSRLGEGWLGGGSLVVRKKFFSKGGRLYNGRLLFERKKYAEWTQKSSDGGKKSWEARKNKGEMTASGYQPDSQRVVSEWLEPKPNSSLSLSLSLSPSTTTKETTTTKATNMSGSPQDPDRVLARQVLAYLNESAGAKYHATDKNLSIIVARMKEGHTVEDFYTVIEGQKQDPYFLQNPKYYRPSTLFAASKFSSYLQAAPKMKASLGMDPEAMKAKMVREAARNRWLEEKDQEELEDARQKSLQS